MRDRDITVAFTLVISGSMKMNGKLDVSGINMNPLLLASVLCSSTTILNQNF
jgi:UDP-N-acetylglucosamine enolpyruvyl transferase